MVAAALPLLPPVIVLSLLFPDLPLSSPFGGALLVQVLLVIPFQRLYRPVTRPRLIRFLVATGLVAVAVMVGVAFALHAAGQKETGLLTVVAGLGGTMVIIWNIQKWLFRAMIERHDTPGEGEAGEEEAQA
jgi:hypothetical protein